MRSVAALLPPLLVMTACSIKVEDLAAPAPQRTVVSAPACTGGTQRATVAALLFGRKTSTGMVSDAEWQSFVDGEIARRFPDGWTVTDGAGGWRESRTGITLQEPSKVMTIVTFDPTTARLAVEAVRNAYKARFGQQSVGLIVQEACAGF